MPRVTDTLQGEDPTAKGEAHHRGNKESCGKGLSNGDP